MLIELKNISVRTPDDNPLLDGVDFRVDENEFVYIIGRVGSGKSSLLKTLYAELPLTGDQAQVLDHNLLKLKRRHVPALRRELGIVFQDFQLLRDLTVEGNLDFVLRATGHGKRKLRQERIAEVLALVGLDDKADRYPHELSGGEQQRVSIARALLNHPRIILADEPTGNLDFDSGAHIMGILREIRQRGTAVVMVTHNLNYLSHYPGIVYRMEDGTLREVTEEYNRAVEIIDKA
ncbi:MAG: cell division ATP-binding protein FtsE [Alloprevotella sp.]